MWRVQVTEQQLEKIFVGFAAVFLLTLSLVGDQPTFHSLEWQLASTPAGVVYAVLSGSEGLVSWIEYLVDYEMSGSFGYQALIAGGASLLGLLYIKIEESEGMDV